MKRIISMFMTIMLFLSFSVYGKDINSLTGKSLLLASGDGKILFEKNIDEKLPIASVTKITTALLVMEAVSMGEISFDDVVTISQSAAMHTGSHIYLDVGEQITVRDLMKGLMVASGNDASIALSECVSGSQEKFVEEMNACAKRLGMNNTHYENCHGLDSDNHYSTARDVFIVTSELMKHKEIFEFSTIWMDSLRNGSFQLSSTNKLIRFYDGATGMKTGSTSKAKYCISATAKRGDMDLICVVLAAPSSKERFADASTLLNYGFDNYDKVKICEKDAVHSYVNVNKGIKSTVGIAFEQDYTTVEKKSDVKNMTYKLRAPITEISAPINKGAVVAVADVYRKDEKIGEINLVANETVKKINVVYMMKCIADNLSHYIL